MSEHAWRYLTVNETWTDRERRSIETLCEERVKSNAGQLDAFGEGADGSIPIAASVCQVSRTQIAAFAFTRARGCVWAVAPLNDDEEIDPDAYDPVIGSNAEHVAQTWNEGSIQ